MWRAGKKADPFYLSKEWRAAREERLRMDGHTCIVPGCGQPAIIVDHCNPSRPRSLQMKDLRSLCRGHDNQVKEQRGGTRRQGGAFRGCDADGWPVGSARRGL